MSRGPWKGPRPFHIKKVIAAVIAAGLRVHSVLLPDGTTVVVDNAAYTTPHKDAAGGEAQDANVVALARIANMRAGNV